MAQTIASKPAPLFQSLVRRASLRTLLVFVPVLIITGAFLGFSFHKFPGLFIQPEIEKAADIETYFNKGYNYVRLKGSGIINTGYTTITTKTNKKTREVTRRREGVYALIPFEDGLVLAKIPYDPAYEEITVINDFNRVMEIQYPSKESRDARNAITARIAEDNNMTPDQAAGAIFGLHLNYKFTHINFLRGLYLLFFGGFLLSLYMVFQAMSSLRDYQSHPSYKALSKFGDPSAVERALTQAMDKKDTSLVVSRKNFYFFHDYIVYQSYTRVHLYPADMLGWVYKKVVKRSVNGIPVGKEYSVMLNFYPKRFVSILVKNEKEADEIVASIASKCDVLAGYTKENAAAYHGKVKALKKEKKALKAKEKTKPAPTRSKTVQK